MTVDGDNAQAWPVKNKTVDGGNVEDATQMTASLLKVQNAYTGLGWDFANVWKIDPTNAEYPYPVLKQFGTISTGIKEITKNITNATYGIHVSGNVLTITGLKGTGKVNVTNVAGQRVIALTTNDVTATTTLPGRGIYIITIVNNGTTKSYKVVNQ